MDLDNLKELWNKEDVSDTPEVTLDQQKEIYSPLEKIRKNMRIEFWYTIICYPFLFVLTIWYAQSIEQGNVLIVLTTISMAICAYYFLKFKSLYQKINTQDFSTFHKLLNLRYELVLNTELYKSYYVSYIPIAFSTYFVMFGVRNTSISNLLFVVGLTFLLAVTLIYIGKIWIREFYGKYIVQISDLIMELSDEKDDFVYDRKDLKKDLKFKPFRQTTYYFQNKFGDIGVLFNILFWMFISIIMLLITAFVIGFVVGFLSVYLK
jgi:hypothetical protein